MTFDPVYCIIERTGGAVYMYMPRKIDKFLADWKSEKDRKPIIVKGSRQVGKTESIRHFAADNYDSFIDKSRYLILALHVRNM